MFVGFVSLFRRRAAQARPRNPVDIQRLEPRVLFAVSNTDVVGSGTFGGANFVPLHNFNITSISSNSVVSGSTNVENRVINIAANGSSANIVMTGNITQAGSTDPPHTNFFVAVINDGNDNDLDEVEPNLSNSTWTWNFTVSPGQTSLRYQARKTGSLDVSGLTGTIGVNRIPLLATNTGASVNEGATVTIGQSKLRVTDADSDTITYTVASGGTPGNGALRKNGSTLSVGSTFTQSDVNSNNITYVHGGGENTSDSFKVTASDGNFSLSQTTFSITIGSGNDAPTISVNTGLTVIEGQNGAITSSKLAATDIDNSADSLVFKVTDLPDRGTLLKNGSALAVNGTFTKANLDASQIVYQHNGSETTSDSFDFVVTDPSGASTGDTFNITVTPSNDQPTLATNNPLSVIEGSTKTITSSLLQVSDVDNSASQIVYTLASAPASGTLQKNFSPLGVNGTFTQADINGGLITYTQTVAGVSSDSFSFVAQGGSGGGATPIGPFTFTVMTLPNTPPSIDVNLGLFVVKGDSNTITTKRLHATDANHAAAELTYTITTAPTGGSIRKSGSPLSAGGTFTQADIDNNLVTYQHNNGGGTSDSFTFTVSDPGNGQLGATQFGITVLPVDPAAGGTLYAASKNVANAGFFPSNLYTVDPLSGEFTLVGPIQTSSGQSFSNVSGLAFLNDGRLVGTCIGEGLFSGLSNGTFAAALININPNTGVASVIGKIADNQNGVAGRIPDLAYDSATDTLYGYGNQNPSAGFLFEINTGTGVGTLLGPAGFSEKGNSIEIDPATGTLLQTGSFNPETLAPDADPPLLPGEINLHRSITIQDRDTGARTPILATVGNVPDQINAMDFNAATGVLYGIEDARVGPTPAPVRDYFLVTIDKTTGVATRIGPALDGSAALAWKRLSNAAPRAEVSLVGNGKAISNGDTKPSTLDDTDFGVITSPGQTITKTFTIRNKGLATLSLAGGVQIAGDNPGDFTVVSQPASSVAAGGSTTFQVQFSPTGQGLRTAVVRVTSNDVDEPTYDFTVRGTDSMLVVTFNGQPVSDDFQINLGTLGLAGSSIVDLVVTAQGLRPITIGAITSPPADSLGRGWKFFNPPSGVTLQPGQSAPLQVQFLTEVPGDYGNSGSLIPTGGESVDVPITGNVQASADAFEVDDEPASAKSIGTDGAVTQHSAHTLTGRTGGRGFSSPATATSADVDWQTFTLTERTSVAIRLTPSSAADGSLRSDDMELSLFGPGDANALIATDQSVGSDSSADIARVDSLALEAGTYFVRAREVGGDQVVARYGLSVLALAPTAEVTVTRNGSAATGADFPEALETGTASDPITFTISNDGATPLSISGFGTTGANPGDFIVTIRDASGNTVTGSAFEIAPGSSFSAAVVFQPTGGGARSASLAFTTNDSDEPSVSLALIGTGIAKGLTVSSVVLAGVPVRLVGGAKSKITAAVVLRNEGESPVAGPVTVEIVASTDGIADSNDAVIGRFAKNQKIKLAAASKPIKIKLTIPPVSADGEFFIIARATGTGITGQSTGQSATKLTIESPVVNIVPNTLAPVNLKTAKNGTFALNVSNNGNTMAKGLLTASLTFTDTGGATVGTAISTLKVGLKPLTSKNLKGKIAAPAIAPGTYTLAIALTAAAPLGAPNLSDGAIISVQVTILP